MTGHGDGHLKLNKVGKVATLGKSSHVITNLVQDTYVTVANIPSDYRPSRQIITYLMSHTGKILTLVIRTSGDVEILAFDNTSSAYIEFNIAYITN